MKLSVCLATFNEEQFIHYPLDSVYDIADEIIIVDGGSSDKTLAIAEAYGDKVKVINTDNPPMFHINKQKALDAASGEWILQLDADEALSPELKEEIVGLINSSGEDEKFLFPGYWIPRKNFFLTRFLLKGGQYPDYTIRFYKNGSARFPCKTVHENVEIIPNGTFQDNSIFLMSATRLPGTLQEAADKKNPPGQAHVGYMKEALLHYADPDFSRYLHRWDRYTTLDANLMVKNVPPSPDGSGEVNPLNEVGTIVGFIKYFIVKPSVTFFLMYFRHKGFMDGFPGFVFALFSSIRFWLIYIKVWQKIEKSKNSIIS